MTYEKILEIADNTFTNCSIIYNTPNKEWFSMFKELFYDNDNSTNKFINTSFLNDTHMRNNKND